MLSLNTKGDRGVRSLTKKPEPEVLRNNKAVWLFEYLCDKNNSTKKYRYRNKEIKKTLKEETFNKCVYCESKIGHNTPGDIEHKVPSSVDDTKHFDWDNLTIACTECNRRKNDYFDVLKPFLDPYVHGIEARVVHLGPVVNWAQGDVCAEISIRELELNGSRIELISRKIEAIDNLNNIVGRLNESDPLIKELMFRKISELKGMGAEYSGMLCSVCRNYGL